MRLCMLINCDDILFFSKRMKHVKEREREIEIEIYLLCYVLWERNRLYEWQKSIYVFLFLLLES